jgi:acetyltransferase-like isoleucine patch superfamily enzyme
MRAAPIHVFARQLAGGVFLGPGRLSASVVERLKRRHCFVGVDSILLPPSRIENFQRERKSTLIGSNARIAGELLTFAHRARIQIGDNCFIGEGTRIWSANSISILHQVLISHCVNIHDTDSHSISAVSRNPHTSAIRMTGHPAHFRERCAALQPDVGQPAWCVGSSAP